MRMRFEQILAQYGQSVRLERRGGEGAADCRAFLQPITGRDAHLPAATPLGAVCPERWLCLSREQTAPGDRVIQGQRAMTVLEARGVSIADELIYWRAILGPEREAAV